MTRMKIAILGMGSIGLAHFLAAQAAGLKVVGFSSRKEAVLRGDFTGINCNLGVKGQHENVTGMHTTTDYRALLRDDNVDTVIVALPTKMHYQVGLEAAKAGKNALMEKPLACNSSHAVSLKAAFADRGLRLGVGHCLPFFSAYRWLRDTLHSPGEFGELLSLDMVRKVRRPQEGFTPEALELSMGGGMDLGIHEAHLLIHGRGMPQSVSAVGTFEHAYPVSLTSRFAYSHGALITTICGAFADAPKFHHSFNAVFSNGTGTFDGDRLQISGGGQKNRVIEGNDALDVFMRELTLMERHWAGGDAGALSPQLACQALSVVEAQIQSALSNGKAMKPAS